jgi:hypothetical protein
MDETDNKQTDLQVKVQQLERKLLELQGQLAVVYEKLALDDGAAARAAQAALENK